MKLTHGLALTAMLAGAAAFAQTSSSSPSTSSPPPGAMSAHHEMSAHASAGAATMSPTGLLSMLHQVNQDEIHLGKLAQTKAKNDKVKDYAKMMVDDHGALDKKVSKFATDNKLTLAATAVPADIHSEMKSSGEEVEHRLSSATSATFDRDYMEAMSKGHGKVLANLDAALPGLKEKKDDKTYDFVKTARDKVEDHKKSADDILRDLRGEAATGGSGMHNDTVVPSENRQSVGSGAPGATTGSTGSPSSTPSSAPPPSGGR